MKRLESRIYVMKFGSFVDSTSSIIENKLKAVYLRRWEVQEKRVTVFNLRTKKRSSTGASSETINSIANSPEITSET